MSQAPGCPRAGTADLRCLVVRIADGLIAEEWICSDMATLLGQLG